jgi:hypothetical protein
MFAVPAPTKSTVDIEAIDILDQGIDGFFEQYRLVGRIAHGAPCYNVAVKLSER